MGAPSVIQIKVDAQTSGAVAALERVAGGVSRIGASLMTGFGIDIAARISNVILAIPRLVESTIEAQDEFGKLAQKTGDTVENLSALSYAAKLANVEQGELGVGLKTVANQLDAAAKGSKAAEDVFKNLGVPIRDADGNLKTLNEILFSVSDRFQQMPDGILKTAAANDLFGRSGQNLIPLLNEGSAGIREMTDEARRLGVVMDKEAAASSEKFNDNLTRVRAGLAGTGREIVNTILPALNSFAQWLVDSVKWFRESAKEGSAFESVLKTIRDALLSIAVAIVALKAAGIFTAIFGSLSSLGEIAIVISLIGQHIKALFAMRFAAAASPIGLLIVSLFSLIEVFRAAREGMALWNARTQEKNGLANLTEQNKAYAKSLLDIIEARERAGGISETGAAKRRKLIEESLQTDPASGSQILRTIGRGLIGPADKKPDSVSELANLTEADARLSEAKSIAAVAANKALGEKLNAQNEIQLKQQLISLQEYYGKKVAMAQAAAQQDEELLTFQIAGIDKLIEQTKKSQLLPDEKAKQIGEAEIKRAQLEGELAVSRQKLAQEENQILADRVDAEKSAAEEIGAARVTIAEQTGEKLLAVELRIKQEFAKLRESLANSTDKNKPTAAQIDAAEKAALNNAKLALQFEAQDKEIQKELLNINERRAVVEADFRKTDLEKRPEIIELLRREKELYDQQVAALEKKLLLAASPAERELIQQRLDSFRGQQSQAGTNLNQEQGQPDPNSFRDQFTSVFTQLENQMGTFAQNMAQTFSTVFDSAISGISNGIMGLINKTMTWKEALLSVASTIVTTLVQSLVQYAVRWIATQILMATVGKTIQAAALAANAGIAAAQSAIWATPATLATIASYGSAAAAAPGLIGLAQGIVLAQSVAAFREGGYTGDGPADQTAGVVHRGEYVVPKENAWLFPLLEKVRAGAITAQNWSNSVSVSRPVTSDPNASSLLPGLSGASGAGGSPNVNVQGHSMKVMMVGMTESDVRRMMEEELPDRVVNISRQRRNEIGINS